MTLYRRKKELTWGERWTGQNYGVFQQRFSVHFRIFEGALVFNTIDGNEVRVVPGDWVFEDSKGWPYPCKDDVFRDTYEAVREMPPERFVDERRAY